MSKVDIDKAYGKLPQATKACVYLMRPEKEKVRQLLELLATEDMTQFNTDDNEWQAIGGTV